MTDQSGHIIHCRRHWDIIRCRHHWDICCRHHWDIIRCRHQWLIKAVVVERWSRRNYSKRCRDCEILSLVCSVEMNIFFLHLQRSKWTYCEKAGSQLEAVDIRPIEIVLKRSCCDTYWRLLTSPWRVSSNRMCCSWWVWLQSPSRRATS